MALHLALFGDHVCSKLTVQPLESMNKRELELILLRSALDSGFLDACTENLASSVSPNNPTALSPKPIPQHLQKLWAFPWWHTEVFHARVRLASGMEGVLVDCGAVDNMSGDKWVQRVADQAKAAGQGTSVQAIRPLSVEGVGSGSSKADSKATIPVCLADGRIDKFETIVQQLRTSRALWFERFNCKCWCHRYW